MYIFNCLITVENMEIDHSCFDIYKTDFSTYKVPQNNGYDVILKSNIYPLFVKTPSFMVNNIVHPVSYDTKTVYLKLIYLSLNNDNIDNILPFGESIKEMFIEATKQKVPFTKVINKLILSQFPSFTEYMENISGYISSVIQPKIEPTSIKIKRIDTPIVFKSTLFNNMKLGVKQSDAGDYDESLEKLYIKYIEDALIKINPLHNNNLYSYPYLEDPEIYPYIEYINRDKLTSLARVVFNAEIYFQVLNSQYTDTNTSQELENAYKIKRAYYSLLKAYYFSYHMLFNEDYGYLYYPLPSSIHIPKKHNNDIYYPVWTLNQCNSIKNKETLINLILKTVWHNNKFLIRKIDNSIRTLIRGNNNDMHIFKFLNNLYKQFTPKDTGFDKGQFRFNEIEKSKVFSKLPTINKDKIRYLDFGGGIGDVGASIAKNMGFLKQNSFVTDIQNWLGKEHTEEYSKYITYRYLKTNDLPFEDEEFHFITCLQVLHHIYDKEYTISQLYRILNKQGILLIREHNCENIQDRMLIDLEHSLHAFVVDEQGQDYLQNYNDNYMNKEELNKMMTKVGFYKITSDIIFPEDKGITKYYYSLWKKQPEVKKNWADYSDDED